jgi:hypothetical protein
MHLIGPASKRWHKSDPALVSQHGALAALLSIQHVTVDAAPSRALVASVRPQLVLEDGRHEWICVDLPVRVAQRHADRLAAILKYVDVADVADPAQLLGAITPDFDQVLYVLYRLLPE